MAFIIGFCILAVAYWFWKTNSADRLTKLPYGAWMGAYSKLKTNGKRDMAARSLIYQAVHYAVQTRGISREEGQHMLRVSSKMTPQGLIAELNDIPRHQTEKAIGRIEVLSADARLVGAMLIVAWQNGNAGEEAVKEYVWRAANDFRGA